MSKLWWKILSALLVLITLVFGLRAPLAPGVPMVSPDKMNNGVTSVTITGYNTHSTENPDKVVVWLTNGDAVFCPYDPAVVDDPQLRATLSNTAKIADSFFDLCVNTPKDGTMYLPSAFLQNKLEVSLQPDRTENCA